MNLDLTYNLAPLMLLCISWSSFMLSKSLVVSLVALLLSSLSLPTLFMDSLKAFWPCGLLLILMSTGMIVVFAYITSLHEGGGSLGSKFKLIYIVGFILTLLFYTCKSHISSQDIVDSNVSMNLVLSLILIYILLFLVINFVRLVYSKGGGFRKKY